MEEVISRVNGQGSLGVRLSGFERDELVQIRAETLEEAYLELGRREGRLVKQLIREGRLELGEAGWARVLATMERKLSSFQDLVRSRQLEVAGVNWPERYYRCLTAFCKGAEVDLAEGVYLQVETGAGCQTLMVQDAGSGQIRLIHTEEDMGYLEAGGQYRYRWVEIELPEQKISYFAYPGVAGWGPAFSVNETAGLVEMVDDLYIKPKHNQGPLWANAMAFMLVDVGKRELIDGLVERVKALPGVKFDGGYAVHLAWWRELKTCSVEFGGERVVEVAPAAFQERLVVAQANGPLDEGVKRLSFSALPSLGEDWTKDDSELFVEMNERRGRLLALGMEEEWSGLSAGESISKGLEVLASPEGDLGRYIDDWGHVRYYSNGLPSRVTVAHLVAYLGLSQAEIYVGKLLPRPIPGREYSTRVSLDYRFGQKRIWEEAAKLRRDYYSRM